MTKTGISWVQNPDGSRGEVWNPVTGCTRVSAGCDHCYAFALHDMRYALQLKAARASNNLGDVMPPAVAIDHARVTGQKLPFPPQYDVPFSKVQLHEDRLETPLHWRRPRRVFVNSMSDLFHDDVPSAFIARVFATMSSAPMHTFQVLTKRPERMRHWVKAVKHCEMGWLTHNGSNPVSFGGSGVIIHDGAGWPLPNVWLGVSVEDQAAADSRIPELLATPAAVRFLSCEPLLGEIDLHICPAFLSVERELTATELEDLKEGLKTAYTGAHNAHKLMEMPAGASFERTGPMLDWVIVGGESGPHFRPMELSWLESIVGQCKGAGVSVFTKQDSGSRSGLQGRIPDDLWLHEFPAVAS